MRAPRAIPRLRRRQSKYPPSTSNSASACGSAATFAVRVAPIRRFATSSGASSTSVETTSMAPAKRAARAVSRPMGPEPVTMTRFPLSGAGPRHGMQCHAQRLRHRELQQVGIGWHGHDLVLAQHELLREASLHVGESSGAAEKEHVRAEIRTARAAVVTGEAGTRGIQRGLCSRQQVAARRNPSRCTTPDTSCPSTSGSRTRKSPTAPRW